MRVSVKIAGIQADTPEDDPIVMLTDKQGSLSLPVWIGEGEAQLLSLAMNKVEIPRPFTHDLVISVLEKLEHEITEVCINAEREGIFWAEIVLDNGIAVDCRPSDGIIVSQKIGCELTVEAELLDRFGIELKDSEQETITDEEVEEFQKLLDNISAEDFMNDDGDDSSLGNAEES